MFLKKCQKNIQKFAKKGKIWFNEGKFSFNFKFMGREEKIEYMIRLLTGIWLIVEKIDNIKNELSKKSDDEIDEIVIKLEQYYKKQNILDKEFIKNLDKINNQIDESIDSTIEKFEVEQLQNFNF